MNERNLPADTEKTRRYYQTHFLCDCGHCRNYYPQVRGRYPKLAKFLKELGADIARPDEIMTGLCADGIVHYDACYTVCSTAKAEPGTLGMREGDVHLELTVQDGFFCPNEQEGDYFSIMVWGIQLPWVLDEPFEGAYR